MRKLLEKEHNTDTLKSRRILKDIVLKLQKYLKMVHIFRRFYWLLV